MRKLRSDITLKEGADFAASLCSRLTTQERYYLLDNLSHGREWQPSENRDAIVYPDSFYEQPPVGSFGKFWDGAGHYAWDYLAVVDHADDMPYRQRGESIDYDNGFVWPYFEPGLPTNVDEQGWPK